MSTALHALGAEFLKLRRSSALAFVVLLPLLFLGAEFIVFERPALGLHLMPPGFKEAYETMQLKTLGAFWVGFFHPLLLSLIPALVFWPEHKYRQWRHLHALPIPRAWIFLAKALVSLLLCAVALGIVGTGLWIERHVLSWVNPVLESPAYGFEIARLLGWTWLGSFPLLGLYLWVSDRINSIAVPLVFGLLGVLMTVALSGQELARPWLRDLNPWVLPYACAQRTTEDIGAAQIVHPAGTPFAIEPNRIRLPSGKVIKTWQNIPDEVLFPPPPPTPWRVLASFSLALGALLVSLGSLDAGRDRL